MAIPATVLFSVIESPAHPNFTQLYKRLEIRESKFNSMRKTIAQLKKQRPDFIVAEFSYGYSSNYAGVNISNLDVLLASLRKYAPQARVIVMVDKSEQQYVGKLAELFPLYAVLPLPVREQDMEAVLTAT
jgi:DNA-binding NarL/FixJ family response regulator